MSELLIRPGRNDHLVMATLLAGRAGIRSLRPLAHGLVLDATVAAGQPAFAQAAQAAGTPVLIDPLTFFLQGDLAESDPWARLPYGRAGAVPAAELADPATQAALAASVVDFEIDHGATGIVPPYVLVGDDPAWLAVATELLARTRDLLDRRRLGLPLVAVVALSYPRRAGVVSWRRRLDRLATAAAEAGADRLGLAVSGTGSPTDGQDRVRLLLSATGRLASQGQRVIAWRQGLLGPGAVAAGACGYECGIGLREAWTLAGLQASRRPGKTGEPFSPPAGVFIAPLGRSLPRKAAAVLLADRTLAPRVVCDDERCCPKGAQSTLADPRPHAVRARAAALAELDRMPSASWRLNAVARWADNGAVLADLASRVLHTAGRKEQVPSAALAALADAADLLRDEGGQVA